VIASAFVSGRDVDLDEIGLGAVRVDREPGLGQTEGHPLRAPVVVREPVDVVVEGVDARGGYDPAWAHGAAEEVLHAARISHHLGEPARMAPSGQPRPLREAERDGVEAAADSSRILPLPTAALSRRAPSR
jgi:hypothetical protein